MEIGAQFFTLREFCQTLEGFAEALARVADIGYRTVQVSGTCAFEADRLRVHRRGLHAGGAEAPGGLWEFCEKFPPGRREDCRRREASHVPQPSV